MSMTRYRVQRYRAGHPACDIEADGFVEHGQHLIAFYRYDKAGTSQLESDGRKVTVVWLVREADIDEIAPLEGDPPTPHFESMRPSTLGGVWGGLSVRQRKRLLGKGSAA